MFDGVVESCNLDRMKTPKSANFKNKWMDHQHAAAVRLADRYVRPNGGYDWKGMQADPEFEVTAHTFKQLRDHVYNRIGRNGSKGKPAPSRTKHYQRKSKMKVVQETRATNGVSVASGPFLAGAGAALALMAPEDLLLAAAVRSQQDKMANLLNQIQLGLLTPEHRTQLLQAFNNAPKYAFIASQQQIQNQARSNVSGMSPKKRAQLDAARAARWNKGGMSPAARKRVGAARQKVVEEKRALGIPINQPFPKDYVRGTAVAR